MGLTHVVVEVANAARPSRRARIKMLVDSGAAYAVVGAGTLRKLGIRPTGQRTFILADGTEITRNTGAALFRFQGRDGASTVIFGQPGDAALLGIVTLAALGLTLDPIRRGLRPMPMSLMPLERRQSWLLRAPANSPFTPVSPPCP
jgi:predicted aspartyl protease